MKGARALTPLEIQAVCMAFSGKYTIRNKTLFLLCANIGTRITEALNLNVGDVLQNGEVVDVLYLRRQTVKGKQSGVSLTLPTGARKALISFIAWKREAGERLSKRAPLFVSRQGQGGRLSRKQAHVIFKAAYEKVGLKGHMTTHSPRKSYAKTVYEKSNNDLLVTQRALRHTSVDMTLYYLETISDDVTQAMPNYDFSELDLYHKTSNSKIIDFQKAARQLDKSDTDRLSKDTSQRSS